MNILLLEDELTLAQSATAQIESRGHTVFYAKDLLGAYGIMGRDEPVIQLIIADHNLPDGLGIDFIIAMKDSHPSLDAIIVSGCLTDKDVERLELLEIPYFRKPLLYGRVLDYMRKLRAEKAATKPSFPIHQEKGES